MDISTRLLAATLWLAVAAPKAWATGDYQVLHSFETAPFFPDGAVIQGRDGAFYGTTTISGANLNGAIFRVETDGSHSILHEFNGLDGSLPTGSLVQGGDGTIYGFTKLGGPVNAGVLFRINTDGSAFAKLHDFDYTTGSQPSSLVLVSRNILYGTAATDGSGTGGGFAPGGTIFRVGTDGSAFTVIYDLSTSPDPFVPVSPIGLLMAGDRSLVGTSTQGGANGAGTIFRLRGDGSGFGRLHDFDFASGNSPVSGVIQGKDGLLYGTCLMGGALNYGVIFRLAVDGSGFAELHEFDQVSGTSPQAGLVQDDNGEFFGTTSNGGPLDLGVIFRLGRHGQGFSVIRAFDGSEDGNQPVAPLLVGRGQTLYGVTRSAGVLFSIGADGSHFTELYRAPWTDGAEPLARLVLGADGGLFGDTWAGGSTNVGVVFSLGPGGKRFRRLLSFNGIAGANLSDGLSVTGGVLFGTTANGGSTLQGGSLGTVFKINVDGSRFSTLTNGQFVGGGLGPAILIGADGRLYGEAPIAGPRTCGSIYAVNPDGTGFLHLHDFDFSDGCEPLGGLTQGPDGSLYGVTVIGGNNNLGVVFRVAPDGSTFTKLFDFDGNSGANPAAHVLLGQDGALYGAVIGGGTSQAGTLFRLSVDGSHFTKLYDFDGTHGGIPFALIQASDGALYGVTFEGGANNFGVIFGIRPDGSGFEDLFDFDMNATGGNSVAALVEAHDGSFYGTAQNGGPRGGGVVFRFRGRLAPSTP